MISLLRKRFPTYEALWSEVWNLFKFGVVGATSLALNTGTYWLLSRVLWADGSRTLLSVIAVCVASVFNFLMHRAWTFQSRAFNAAMVLRYVMVLIAGTALYAGLFHIGHEIFGWNDLVVVVAASLIIAGGTYVTHRWFTFHPKHG